MASKDYRPTIDVDNVLSNLTLDEKISLVSGTDFWHTASIKRLGVPSIRVSDGPNGIRGTKFFNGAPGACFPCGTAIAATWNLDLAKRAGELQAKEAIAKGVSAILGPTVNIQRSPIGGRGFESYSEDPTLSGMMAAATINGIQSQGVGATIKHFVCNDQEEKRQSVDSIVSQRAMREIYLKPFQIAQRLANPWAYMSAYNKVNGIHCSEDPFLLQAVLREDWGFDGMVMSDWTGTYSTSEAIKAGLDLEMPGPAFMRGKLLHKAISCGKLATHDLDRCVRRVLGFVKQAMKLGLEENAPENGADSPETVSFLRELSAESIVMLKNAGNILPLAKDKTTAVIGPNAAMAAYCGGGSAALDAYYTVTPLQGISKQCKDVKYTLGAPGWNDLPLASSMTKTKDGKDGLDMTVYLEPPNSKERKSVDYIHVKKSYAMLLDYKCPGAKESLFYADFEGTLMPELAGRYDFSLSVAGTAKLFINDECVVDNATKQTRGGSFFGTGTIEEFGHVILEAGRTYNLKVEFGSDPTATYERPGNSGQGGGGVRIGCARKVDTAEELTRAVELAKSVDQVIICAGLNADWESEGFDREHMDLPPGSNELIETVVQANPNTVVVLQSGTPVTMPWIQKVNGLLQAWYGGNECGNAIADVVFGDVNPSGRLPLTFPTRLQDNPAYLNTRVQGSRVLYGEDVYVGYRYYEAVNRTVEFNFGFGLSYTTFTIQDLSLDHGKDDIKVSVGVTNKGKVAGSEVIQVYVDPPSDTSALRPQLELKGLTKIFLEPGKTATVEITMRRKDMTSYWDEERDQWKEEAGEYSILVQSSSVEILPQATFKVEKTSWWSGL